MNFYDLIFNAFRAAVFIFPEAAFNNDYNNIEINDKHIVDECLHSLKCILLCIFYVIHDT